MQAEMNNNSTILIVEDSDDDYEACVTALTIGGGLSNPVTRCVTGDEAVDYLFRQGEFEDSQQAIPGLILLDLNLPGSDGHEVLTKIKSDSVLKLIPIIIMTSSREEADVRVCYGAGANSYVVKPNNFEGFLIAISMVKDYWLKVSMLPVLSDGGVP